MDHSPGIVPSPAEVGGLTRTELKTSLAVAGVRLNASAEILLDDAVFGGTAAERAMRIEVVECAVADLGLVQGASLELILASARQQGLGPCPPFAGPYLRLASLHQPSAPDSLMSNGQAPTGSVTVASERLRDEYDYPRGFYLRVVDRHAWLRGFRCSEDASWSPHDRFVFRVD